ncbi:ribonuclease T2 [Aulographum hederae CBS 113979]|uniref:ribonuclease T2 n=1 Tax=Aulographum hederae CBS 113979 TaxID=1176131 RepID=A0A6G1GRX7_9PEZI|nr:ribonuclease T2 [Aulographum hederae CBS 113979]
MRTSTALVAGALSAGSVVSASWYGGGNGNGHGSLYGESSLNHTCVLEPTLLSCSAATYEPGVDTCCAETFGGLVLATQFWNTYTVLQDEGQKLPKNSWTLHGLWPDFCNGSYTQYCDLNRQYDPEPSPNTTNGLPSGTPVPPYKGPSIATFLKPFGKFDLLAWMNTYWVNRDGPNADFWGHEFSKHATCFSTFDVPCYGPSYKKHEDVVDFFETAIMYYLRLPTFKWLKQGGVTPSNSTQYTLSDFQGILKGKYGATPYIGCSGPRFNTTEAGKGSSDTGRTEISEVWYYSHVKGRTQEGRSVPVEVSPTFTTTCAKTAKALWYYERSDGAEF